jgi:hypothetical protein
LRSGGSKWAAERDPNLQNELINIAQPSEVVAIVHFWSRLSAGPAHPAGPRTADTVILIVLTKREESWRICALDNVTLTTRGPAIRSCAKPTSRKPMVNIAALISALETAPGVIIPMIREVPPQILKRRPSKGKWSAYEHAVHLSQSDASFRARLDLILSTPEPYIETIHNSAEDEAGALLDIDLDESLKRYAAERESLVKRLRKLTTVEWQKTAVHEAFDHYSVFIMFRHLLNHEMLHAYRIEELLLKKDWD